MREKKKTCWRQRQLHRQKIVRQEKIKPKQIDKHGKDKEILKRMANKQEKRWNDKLKMIHMQ